MKKLPLNKAFTLLEPGPVVLVTTHDGQQPNIMTISWTMVVDFTPVFAITLETAVDRLFSLESRMDADVIDHEAVHQLGESATRPIEPPCGALGACPTAVSRVTTEPWNHSFAALRKSKECVIAIPTVDLLDKVVGVGTCSGTDTDKFAKFKLTPLKASKVKAPLIQECLANIECRVIDYNKKHGVVFLQGVAAWVDTTRKTDKERRMLHAVGDGTFIADGRKLDRRKAMRSKLPAGV